MRTNRSYCYFKSNDVVTGATIHPRIAYIKSLNVLSVALDIVAGEESHTVYFTYSALPQLVHILGSSYFSISETLKQMEAEDGKQS